MQRAKKRGLLRAVWELVQTLLGLVVVVALLTEGFGSTEKTKVRQEEGAQVRQHAPRPQPKRPWLKPLIFQPEPLSMVAEDAEPRHGDVVLDRPASRRSTAFFQEQVAKLENKQYTDYPMFWWSGPEKEVFMITAMGRDKLHHVANAYLLGFQPFVTDELWVPMQTIATRLKYRQDKDEFGGMMDLWQTSKQAYYWLRGDCEDHALLLADWLIEMGYDARVVAGRHGKEGHAWVIVLAQGQTYLLEATSKRGRRAMPLAESLPEYRPEYMFNRRDFWVNTGSTLTVNYRDAKWQRRARFEASY